MCPFGEPDSLIFQYSKGAVHIRVVINSRHGAVVVEFIDVILYRLPKVEIGNAVRKIWIDLGVRIRLAHAPLLTMTKDTKPADLAYFALGTIDYVSDAETAADGPQGRPLYIKPAVRGDEGAADIIAYQRLHPEFPQQSTLDQWFDEPQLEAYRAVGWFILDKLVHAGGRTSPATIEEFFERCAICRRRR
jgi:hypothetical protein